MLRQVEIEVRGNPRAGAGSEVRHMRGKLETKPTERDKQDRQIHEKRENAGK